MQKAEGKTVACWVTQPTSSALQQHGGVASSLLVVLLQGAHPLSALWRMQQTELLAVAAILPPLQAVHTQVPLSWLRLGLAFRLNAHVGQHNSLFLVDSA